MPGLITFRATLRRTGCGLLGHEDDAEAALADLLQQLVRADDRAGAFGDRPVVDGDDRRGGGRLQEAAGLVAGLRAALRPRPRSAASPPQAWSR